MRAPGNDEENYSPTLTVRELIELLQKEDPDALVYTMELEIPRFTSKVVRDVLDPSGDKVVVIE